MSASIEHVHETLTGSPSKNEDTEEKLYHTLKQWGFQEGVIEEGRTGIDVSARVRSYGDNYADHLEETFGTKHPFLAGVAAGKDYRPGEMGADKSVKAVDDMVQEKGVVDASTVQEAVPIVVDPMVVDIQRSRAPVLDRITTQAQAGYEAKYNVIAERSEPIAYAAEADVIDLSDLSVGDFGMVTDSEDMKIYVDQINISDFSQRATDSLDYMNLENTTIGQRTISWALTKAAAYFYADPTADESGFADGYGYESLGTSNTFDGFTRIATNANNDIDRTTVDATANGQPLLEDIKDQLTTHVENTGLTYADAEIFVSSSMFDTLENEGNPVTRLTSFSEGINFGARQLSIKNVPVTECPNISPNFELPWSGSPEDEGNVFLVDRRAMQFRALAPLFTLPLGRQGLADRAAMAEYGTLLDKSQGNHTLWLQYAI